MKRAVLPRCIIMAILLLAVVLILLHGDFLPTASAEDDFTPPVADAGDDMLVNFVTAARFNGTNSTDDVGISQFRWTFEHAGEPVELFGPIAYFPFTVHGVYNVTLNVTDAAGNWDTDTIVVTVLTPPGRPSRIMAIDYDGHVDISWGEAEHDGGVGVSGYILYKGDAPDALMALFMTDSDFMAARDVHVENGVTYYYAVAAFNEIWIGPMTEVVNATPIAAPAPPANISVRSAEERIVIRWDEPNETRGRSPVTGYVLYRGKRSDVLEPIAELDLVDEYIDDDVEVGRTYFYAIGSQSEIGQGNISEVSKVKVEQEVPFRDQVLTITVLIIPWVIAIAALAWWSGRQREGARRETEEQRRMQDEAHRKAEEENEQRKAEMRKDDGEAG